MLTDVEATAAQAREKDYKLADVLGLYLYVTRSGFKSWRMKYRYGGKEKRLTLGSYPDVSLQEARDRRDEARRLLREKIDPAAQRHRFRTAASPADGGEAVDMVEALDDAEDAAPREAASNAVRPYLPGAGWQSREQRVHRDDADGGARGAASYAREAGLGQSALNLVKQAEIAAESAARDARIAKWMSLLAFVLLAVVLIVTRW